MRNRAKDDAISEAEAERLFGLLAREPALVLAVSGGPDSTALLWLAARWRDGLERPPKLVAVTVDHGLRKESAAEARAVKRLAGKLKVVHWTSRWTGAKPKTGIQEAARNARYRLLSEAAHKAKARHVLTAHTLDDQAETLLFRMARGSGVSGLAGMSWSGCLPVPEGRGLQLIRPLLEVPKARLIATLDAAKVPYATDPSNVDPRFARPRFRALMPLLAREGLTAERLCRLARRVERVEDALSKVLDDAQIALWPARRSQADPASVETKAFLDLPGEIGLRLLQRMIAVIGDDGRAELGQLEALHADLRAAAALIGSDAAPAAFRRTLAGAMITVSGVKLTVERAPPRRSGAKKSTPGPKAPFTKTR